MITEMLLSVVLICATYSSFLNIILHLTPKLAIYFGQLYVIYAYNEHKVGYMLQAGIPVF